MQDVILSMKKGKKQTDIQLTNLKREQPEYMCARNYQDTFWNSTEL